MSGVEEQIRRAMEEGKFSNLRGKGKPLRLDDNPLEDSEWRAAYQMLRSSGFTLPWIETRQEIESELEKARAELSRARAWQQRALDEKHPTSYVEAEWGRALEVFRERVGILNKRIFSYNLEVPSEQFQRRTINVEREIDRVVKPPEE